MALTNLKAPIPKYLIDLLANALNRVTSLAWGSITGTLSDQTDLQNSLNAKQTTLLSGTNIKTVNSTSLLGGGNLDVTTPPSGSNGQVQFNDNGAFGSNSNLNWDNLNDLLGVGDNGVLPARLSVKGKDNAAGLTISATNLAGGKVLRTSNDGYTYVGNSSTNSVWIGSSYQTFSVPTTTETGQNNLVFSTALGNIAGHGFVFTNPDFTFSPPSGTANVITFGEIEFVASSGTGAFVSYNVNPTISQTGTANGTVRGLYYNPTLTSVLGTHIAFENTTGEVRIGTTSGTLKVGSQTEIKSTGEFAFSGVTPTAAQTGWTISNPVVNRTLDVTSATLADLREIVGTLLQDQIDKGIIKT